MGDKITTQNSGNDEAEQSTPEAQADKVKVLAEVRKQAAMPLIEISAATGVRGEDLDKAVQKLEEEQLVEVKKAEDPLDDIVAVKDPK